MAEYDAFADQYDKTFELVPLRTYVEAHSILKLLGEVTGEAWLDLACGTGAYTRELRRRGAGRALGVDLSPEMIRVAQLAEEERLTGAEYQIADVGGLGGIGRFDGALGVYLLHYSTSMGHLEDMCVNISRSLRPGGRFVTYQLNPDLSLVPDYYLKYGADFQIPVDGPLEDGQAFTFRISVPGLQSPHFTVYYWSRTAIEQALTAAGFNRIRWVMPELSPEGHDHPDPQWWRDHLDRPFAVLLEAEKD